MVPCLRTQKCLKIVKLDRFDADDLYHADRSHLGMTIIRNDQCIEGDTRHFDVQYLQMKVPRAVTMCSQQRLLLENLTKPLRLQANGLIRYGRQVRLSFLVSCTMISITGLE